MSQCPVCQAPVTADFGLVECDQCRAQLIVHMDGAVEHSTGDSSPAEDLGDIFEAEEPEPEPQTELVASAELEAEEFGEFSAEPEGGGEPEPEPEADPDPELQPVVDAYEAFAENGDGSAEPEAYSLAPKASDSPDLSDIAQFGNSESSGGRDGTLRYILYISGIDTSDVRMAFREALTDRKFLWDTDQILRSLKNGQVRIENVSATKAHVLITRLRNMPVKIRWEQYAIHQS